MRKKDIIGNLYIILNMKKTANTGRDFLPSLISALSCYIKSLPVSGFLLSAFPAVLCSCQKEMTSFRQDEAAIEHVISRVSMKGIDVPIKTLDIFNFEMGILQTLDSYQREDDHEGTEIDVASRTGERRLFVCANGHWTRDDWMKIGSYEALKGFRACLENESRIYPIMTGESEYTAGGIGHAGISMERLTCETVLRSLCCDFSGKGYEEYGITDIKVYLINVNARCRLHPEGTVMPERVFNMGGLDPSDMGLMKEPSLLYGEIPSLDSGQSVNPGICLRCYPNNCTEESPGSPFTRLVVEGKIMDDVRYWSINIGRDENGKGGMERNCRYIYDITITGKGSDNPDIPVCRDEADIRMEVKEWKEKEEYVIYY